MQERYHCLKVTPAVHYELFSDFLADTLPVGFEEQDGSFIIRSEEELDTIGWGIEQFAEALQKALKEPVDVELEYSEEANEDWIELYQKSISAIEVGGFYVHPTWEVPREDRVNIAIDPAFAFGTGHHPTTASCLQALSETVSTEKTLLDVGCGSGILSIAAAKLGAEVDACDTDALSVENALENARLNGVDYGNIWEGSVQKRLKTYDIVVANIVADVLVMLASDLKAALHSNGTLILSGILDKYETKVLEAYAPMYLKQRVVQDEWVTLVMSDSEL